MSVDMSAVFAMVLGGLLLAVITGGVLMYRQVGELKIAMEGLTGSLDDLASASETWRKEGREDRERLHRRIDDLQRTRKF